MNEKIEEKLSSTLFRARQVVQDGKYARFIVVCVAMNPAMASETIRTIKNLSRRSGSMGSRVVVATIDDPESLEPGFYVKYDSHFDDGI